MEDLKLKHIVNAIKTKGVIRLNWKDTGESFCPRIGDIGRYYDFYVTGIYARNDELVICIQSEI